jgi:glucosylceramidase
MFARWLRLIVVWSVVFSTFPAAAAVTAESWLTTGDETSKLARQPDLAFLPGNGVHPTRIQIDSSLRYQTMEGFGASLTDSSAWLLNNRLNPEQREAWLRSVFSKDDGIGISYVRQPMGASDFATQWYTYDDVPTGQTDPNLEHFSVAHDDAYIVPNLQRAMTLNPQLQVMASPWSPPAWMKTSGHLAGGSLKPEYHAAYADYFVRFIREYEARGIPIHAVTIQNEPQHTSSTYPTSRMEWSQQAEFIKNNLGPAFETEGIETKIVAWDHNWDNPSYPMSILSDPEANPYVAGTAWHAYAGDVSAQSVVHDAFPDKEIYFTEITGGAWWEDWSDNLVWGVRNIMIGATRNWAKTVTYWNLALDTDHGPHIGGCSNCRGVTTIHPQTGEFELTEEYYVIGHSSKFVDPGAYRIASDSFDGNIETVAYLNPDGSKVLVALNPSGSTRSFDVLDDGECFSYTLPAQSVATFKVWQTLTWDGQGDGHWDDIDGGTGDSHWLDHAGAPVAEYPGSGTHAVLQTTRPTP